MTVVSRAMLPRTGVLVIDTDHEQLQAMMDSAHRAARLGDHPAAALLLERVVRLAELHSREEEDYLMRSNYDRMLDVRRDHERLVLALEELCEHARAAAPDLAERARAVCGFLDDSMCREVEAMRRFLSRAA